jgi:translation initiation factor 5A
MGTFQMTSGENWSGKFKMSQTEIREIRTLKVGRYIVIDNEPCKLVEYITSKPGKHGEAKARMVAIGLFDGQKRSLVHPVKHKVHVPLVDRRKAQILANMGAEIQMMDLETFETFNVPLKDIPEKFHSNMEPGNEIVFLSAMGRKLVTD